MNKRTIHDMAQSAGLTSAKYEAVERPAARRRLPTDDQLRAWWRKHGGEFHGPNIETGTMPEAKLLPLLRTLLREAQPK